MTRTGLSISLSILFLAGSARTEAQEYLQTNKPLRHQDAVLSVAFSRDGQMLASGSKDKTVKLWNVSDGSLLRTLTGFRARVASVAFSPIDERLATACYDGTIKLWDSASGTLLKAIFYERQQAVVTFSHDGKLFAAAGFGQTVNLCRPDGSPIASLRGHRSDIVSLAFSPDDQCIASGDYNGYIKLWRTGDRRLEAETRGHWRAVTSLAFSPDGQSLASVGYDDALRQWTTPRLRLKQNCFVRSKLVYAVAWSPDGKTIATGGWDNNVKLWNARSGDWKDTLAGHKNLVLTVAYSPDGSMLASGSADRSIRLWHISSAFPQLTQANQEPQLSRR